MAVVSSAGCAETGNGSKSNNTARSRCRPSRVFEKRGAHGPAPMLVVLEGRVLSGTRCFLVCPIGFVGVTYRRSRFRSSRKATSVS